MELWKGEIELGWKGAVLVQKLEVVISTKIGVFEDVLFVSRTS